MSLPTEQNKEKINRYFKDRKKWTDENIEGISVCPSPTKVFDEYMTVGVFVIYCKDNFNSKDFKVAKESVISFSVTCSRAFCSCIVIPIKDRKR